MHTKRLSVSFTIITAGLLSSGYASLLKAANSTPAELRSQVVKDVKKYGSYSCSTQGTQMDTRQTIRFSKNQVSVTVDSVVGPNNTHVSVVDTAALRDLKWSGIGADPDNCTKKRVSLSCGSGTCVTERGRTTGKPFMDYPALTAIGLNLTDEAAATRILAALRQLMNIGER